MHTIRKCTHGVIIGQCRCPSSNKMVITVNKCPPTCTYQNEADNSPSSRAYTPKHAAPDQDEVQ